jgi:hypothetical protein
MEKSLARSRSSFRSVSDSPDIQTGHLGHFASLIFENAQLGWLGVDSRFTLSWAACCRRLPRAVQTGAAW